MSTISPPAMHRVRIGLIGLSCVFLLVALAAALLRVAGSDAVTRGNTVDTAANLSDAVPNEPLAQLGVAPGNAPPAPPPATPAGRKNPVAKP